MSPKSGAHPRPCARVAYHIPTLVQLSSSFSMLIKIRFENYAKACPASRSSHLCESLMVLIVATPLGEFIFFFKMARFENQNWKLF